MGVRAARGCLEVRAAAAAAAEEPRHEARLVDVILLGDVDTCGGQRETAAAVQDCARARGERAQAAGRGSPQARRGWEVLTAGRSEAAAEGGLLHRRAVDAKAAAVDLDAAADAAILHAAAAAEAGLPIVAHVYRLFPAHEAMAEIEIGLTTVVGYASGSRGRGVAL